MVIAIAIVATLTATIVADGFACPRARSRWSGRSLVGMLVHGLVVLIGFGLWLAVIGHHPAAAMMTVAVVAGLVVTSNVKHALLGEPLLFSDLALVVAIFRYPQFYVSALRLWHVVVLAGGATLLLLGLGRVFVLDAAPHWDGLLMAAVALAALLALPYLPPWRSVVLVPDAHADVARHGLLATLVLHAGRWQRSIDPPVCANTPITLGATALVVIVQCESFADPVALFGDPSLTLSGLDRARADACRSGRLLVSGFGAYTMRTEYGVLFGRSEADLGFRRFDPYLTALRETSYALPARLRLQGWQSVFVHPFDLRFYGRDRIMPAAGFDTLLGKADFAEPASTAGRYVDDASLGARIIALATAARRPTLIYAVTIENHGPWPVDPPGSDTKASSAYLRKVQNSDAMLSNLKTALSALHRPALLVFFGDHRPSIPGASDPGGDRHTPYVVLCFDANGSVIRADHSPRDLTPAEFHHMLIEELAR